MAKKKKTSRTRSLGKKIIIALNILVSILIIYPIIFTPLHFIWVNGFLGLIMPYLLVVELLFLFFWLIAKPILSLISLLSLMIGWNFVFTIIGFHPGLAFPKNKKENTLRIISWNVRGFNGIQNNTSLKLRTQEIAYSMLKWNPDIICMQEYNTNERVGDIANHAQYFKEKYPYSFFSKDYQTQEFSYSSGCIIYSKYKIIQAERFGYNNKESLIAATILKGDDTIRVFTTHLASFKFKQHDFAAIDDPTKNKWGVIRKMKHAFQERASQAELVYQKINESPYPSIITGDFNDVPSSYTYRKITKGGWQDAFLQKGFGIGATYLGLNPTLRIDYILANPKWKIRAWEQTDENLSDHQMIMADLLLIK
jgi:endonuclease/exonuclease/phosphatase family metal-dependent hydrolase